MSKFKQGDQVRIVSVSHYNNSLAHHDWIGKIGKIINNSDGTNVQVDIGPDWYPYLASDLEPITKGETMEKPYERKTYKLLKDTFEYRKGALFQEKCDDGDQQYVLLDRAFIKLDDFNTYFGGNTPETTRHAIEDQPDWFVEVFKVHPEYMTREELDKWEEFRTGKKPKPTPKPLDDIRKVVSDKRIAKFVEIYNKSNTMQSVAKKMGVSLGTAYTYKSYAKRTGSDLKPMK